MNDKDYMDEARLAALYSTCRKKQLGCVLKFTDNSYIQGTNGPIFPITDEKIEEGLHQPVNSSWRWLSEFLIYHLKQMHLNLKKVHGHIVRVARS